MGAWGALIMGFFGAAFASLTLYREFHLSGPVIILPFIVFILLGLFAISAIRLGVGGIEPSEHEQRVILWSSIGEGVALFLAGNLITSLHRPDLLLPTMALIVGLHFLPIAFAARFRPFYLLGAALILGAIAGFGLGAPRGGELAGLLAAGALWLAAGLAIHRDRHAKRL